MSPGADLEVILPLIVDESAPPGKHAITIDLSKRGATQSLVAATTGLRRVRRINIPLSIAE
ncbi:MAG: hypothetical protein ACTSU5_04100 [Promethearchaeota archaeon]